MGQVMVNDMAPSLSDSTAAIVEGSELREIFSLPMFSAVRLHFYQSQKST
jgi:hypothetical protein